MYGIKKVSEILGIPAVTIRAWENRYQIINPIRSNGGHRLYSDSDIDKLKWIKDQMNDKQIKVSEAISLLLQRTMEESVEIHQVPLFHNIYDDLIKRLYGDLIDLNTTQAHETIDLAFSMYHYDDVFHHILVPVLIQMGEQWESGDIVAAQEHFSSQLIMQRFTQFFRILPVLDRLPRVLAFCPEGELHHIGLMLLSLFMRKKGMDVIYIGPNTPLTGLTSILKTKNISVVTISVTNPSYIEKLEKWIEACRDEFPDLKIVLGGAGFRHCTSSLSAYVISDDQVSWENWYQSAIGDLYLATLSK